MAKPSWCTLAPDYGSGNGTVNVNASEHTGRTSRSGAITFKATGVLDATVSVTQTAKTEFVEINNVSAPKSGGTITVTGKSNSAKLTFSLGLGDLDISLPATYSAGGIATNNGVAIAGDPGATAEYNFSVSINVPENTTVTAQTKAVTVTANGGQSNSATITQSAGDPTLSVAPTSITLDADGTPDTVNVTSNTNWTVE